jgi:hypothetical protein
MAGPPRRPAQPVAAERQQPRVSAKKVAERGQQPAKMPCSRRPAPAASATPSGRTSHRRRVDQPVHRQHRDRQAEEQHQLDVRGPREQERTEGEADRRDDRRAGIRVR